MDDKHVWEGEIIHAPIPKGRDPFVNTNLLSLGEGKDGKERFWISSWNSNAGAMGIVVNEDGECRTYGFSFNGFYSAALEDPDTLWLCGDLANALRLTLSTGEVEKYPTGAPPALVFTGMAMDRKTGKLFAAAYPPPRTTAFSFDFRNKKPVKVYPDICADHYMTSSFPNNDGTHTIIVHTPDVTLLRWDPENDTLQKQHILPQNKAGGGLNRLIHNDSGLWYMPGYGWYDTVLCSFNDGPRPDKEMTWFAARGNRAWGVSVDKGSAVVALWDMATGKVKNLCSVPDGTSGSVCLSKNGNIVAVNLYGEFYCYDGETGALLISKRLPADSYGRLDCIRRIDSDRLLGTPFITQRFWELNIRTGDGFDCGRAAPGGGEILKTWKIGGKIYMAAYADGELVEYDPGIHPHFPENPRVIADPPHGMRPVASADDGRHIYYSCSHHYGNLGCVMTKHDTVTGKASYMDDPIPDQMIRSLIYDSDTMSLVGGTTMQADCQSCPPASDLCYFIKLDAGSMKLLDRAAAPKGTELASVIGKLRGGEYLCTCHGSSNGSRFVRWFVMNSRTLEVPPFEGMHECPEGCKGIMPTDREGWFILAFGGRYELWDMRTVTKSMVLYEDTEVYMCEAQGDSVYLVKPKEVIILEGCLKGLA